MKAAIEQDKFIRYVKDIPIIRGLSVEDASNRLPFPGLRRTTETYRGLEEKFITLKRDSATLLCPGAAVAIDVDGIIRHCYPALHNLKGFLGFVDRNVEGGRVRVLVRGGGIMLNIEGIIDAHVGRTVHCIGANEFTLDGTTGGLAIGEVKFIQPDRVNLACVEFRAYDDPKPLNLKY